MKRHTFLPALAILMLPSCARHSTPPPDLPAAPSLSEVRDVGRIELAEMAISKMGTIDDLRMHDAKGAGEKMQALLNAVKIGDRKGAWSYDTYIRAYIDLSAILEADLTVDTASHTAQLKLPAIQTEIAGRDATMHEEHYRVTGLRSNISAEERARLKEEMNSMLKQEIEENTDFHRDLERKARERARTWFDSLFSSRGYKAEITFKN